MNKANMNKAKRIYTVKVTNISRRESSLYGRIISDLKIKTGVYKCTDDKFMYRTYDYADYCNVMDYVTSIQYIKDNVLCMNVKEC